MEKLWNRNYVLVWSSNFMLKFSFMILTPLLPLYLSDEFGAGKDAIGLVLSGYSLTTMIISPFGGWLVESFPCKVVLIVCYSIFAAMFGGYIAAGSLLLFAVVRTLHGIPMGATTVANNTVALDVLPPSRRAEGVDYFGLASNLATAISPAIGLAIFHCTGNFQHIFILALVTAFVGLAMNCALSMPKSSVPQVRQPLTMDRLFLVRGVKEGVNLLCFSFSYGVVATYLAIYGKEVLHITLGSGVFFVLLSSGLITSRLAGARALRNGHIVENTARGVLASTVGYLIFAAVHNPVGYYAAALIIGLGNGYLYPAFQNMFINLAPESLSGTANSTMFVARNLGMGLGIVAGGVVVEFFSYDTAFWMAWVINAMGVAMFFIITRHHYLKYRMR